MSNQFQVIEVPDNAAEAQEAMGSRFKFWFHHPEIGNCLFKQVRTNTGEDWSEKIAAELAQLLGLPHAEYELAVWQEQPGVISPSFLSPSSELIHGNDILAGLVSSYPKDQSYGLSQHTITLVLEALKAPGLQLPFDWTPPAGITEAVSTFVGYLLLDAWIGNSDRHHENWGFVIQLPQGIASLAPTYDHASCLGRELLDAKKRERLHRQTVPQYAEKARSALYAKEGDKHPLSTFEAFAMLAQRYPCSAEVWLNRLIHIPHEEIDNAFRRIPSHRISSLALEFALQMLDTNRSRLLRLREDLT